MLYRHVFLPSVMAQRLMLNWHYFHLTCQNHHFQKQMFPHSHRHGDCVYGRLFYHGDGDVLALIPHHHRYPWVRSGSGWTDYYSSYPLLLRCLIQTARLIWNPNGNHLWIFCVPAVRAFQRYHQNEYPAVAGYYPVPVRYSCHNVLPDQQSDCAYG